MYLLVGLVVLLVALVIFAIVVHKYQTKQRSETQRHLSDRDLLLRLSKEPDGYLTPESLSKTTQLSKGEARTRLSALHIAGILDQAYNSRMVLYFSLRHPLEESTLADLSTDPFLTVEDLLTVFAACNYRPSDRDLIMATGFPLAIIHREMSYFAEEGVVDRLHQTEESGKQSQRTYVLKEPYRSQPEQFRLRAETDDLALRTILRNDNFIV